MKVERLNREKKIENPLFKIKIGTINKKNPCVIYISGGVFISPIEEKDSYIGEIEKIKNNFKKNINEILLKKNNFDKNYICDFDIRTSGLKKNKKSYLSFEYHVKQNDMLDLETIKEDITPNINNILSELEKDIKNGDFSLSKTKK